jgi:hypothetical protein
VKKTNKNFYAIVYIIPTRYNFEISIIKLYPFEAIALEREGKEEKICEVNKKNHISFYFANNCVG